MAITPGSKVGAYEITALVGEGGMGRVYRARDSKLKRDVAIKALPEPFALDPERVARLHREAEALASLNHPNVAGIHELAEVDGAHFLVMEFVEGETLAERIAVSTGPGLPTSGSRLQAPAGTAQQRDSGSRPKLEAGSPKPDGARQQGLPVDEALPIARQIADALEAAHEQGIVHRDLKPANIKITPAGIVKVLDFGLAKLIEPSRSGGAGGAGADGFSRSPTLSVQATLGGVILGTAAYMSPEQARGKAVDRRTDIWAFGCVLFEMLTGKRAFDGGETISDAVAAILMHEPDWDALPGELPPHIRTLLRRCLQKDPQRRIPHIGIARIEIDEPPQAVDVATTSGAQAAPALHTRRAQRRTLVATAIASAVVAVGVAWVFTRPSPVAPPVVRLHATPATETIDVNPYDTDVAVSPDGTRIAYLARSGTGPRQLFVRALQQGEGMALAGTENARGPFFSPDGQWIGYAYNNADLKKVSVNGGSAVTICQGCAGGFRGGTWAPDDSIVFSAVGGNGGLRRVQAAGGDFTVVEPPKTGSLHCGPEFLPGGRAVLFSVLTAGPDTAQVVVKNLDTGDKKVLIRGGSHARYVTTGHLVYGVSGTLRAIAFNPETIEVSGNPLPVVDGVVTKDTGIADFAVSRNGLLVYISGEVSGSGRGLMWVNRQGRRELLAVPTRTYMLPRLAPDGQRVAVDIRDQQNDVWIWDLVRPTLTRLTFDPALDRDPVWTPDGRRVVFGSVPSVAGAEAMGLFWQSSGGTGSPERLTTSDLPQFPQVFTRDGKWLVAVEIDPKMGPNLILVSMEGEHAVKPLIRTPFSEGNADLSPDGRWMAYESNESGRDEVYVRPFPAVEEGRWQISTGGGTRPLWSRNGRELFYVDLGARLMAVPVKIDRAFSAGSPAAIIEVVMPPVSGRGYDASADATRFLTLGDAASANKGAPQPQLNVVLNWQEELKQRVPTR